MSVRSHRSASNEYDIKLVIVGRCGVGKSTLLHRFIHGAFAAYLRPNARVETEDLRMTRNHNHVRLRIWDTAGQERFRSLTRSYYRGVNAVIVAFDVTHDQSFRDITHWYDDVKALVQPNGKDVLVIVVGTKCNLTAQRVVSLEDGQKWALETNLTFMEVSAETGYNVSVLFETIVDKLLKEQEVSKGCVENLKIDQDEVDIEKTSKCCFHIADT